MLTLHELFFASSPFATLWFFDLLVLLSLLFELPSAVLPHVIA